MASLEPGEILVHAQHGVCRFRATETNKVGGVVQAYLVLDFADGTLREQAGKAPAAITRYLGSGLGYRRKTRAAGEGEAGRAGEEGPGPALDHLSRPEIWKKRKSKGDCGR